MFTRVTRENYYSNLGDIDDEILKLAYDLDGKFGGVIYYSENSKAIVTGLKYEHYLGAKCIMRKVNLGLELTKKKKDI